jgi:metallo-beta-lactamase family protein
MAISATAEYLAHTEEHDAAMKERMMKRLDSLRRMVQVARSQSESRAITNRREPAVILSASGMVTGGRILHHLAARLPDPKNTVLFAGFQAAGTRGRTILDGAGEVKIHGRMVPVRAQVAMIHELSAHADYAETLTWLRGFHKPPKLTFLVHGEPGAADALAERIRRELGWETLAPEYMQEVRLE